MQHFLKYQKVEYSRTANITLLNVCIDISSILFSLNDLPLSSHSWKYKLSNKPGVWARSRTWLDYDDNILLLINRANVTVCVCFAHSNYEV